MVSPVGGNGSFTYVWNPYGGTNATADSLTAGQYIVNVFDGNGCQINDTIVINEPSAVIATTSQIDVNCNGDNTGSAIVAATGGVPGYTYLWSPTGGTNASAINLAAGNYSVLITDVNGCTDISNVNINITQPSALNATITVVNAVSCNAGADGSAVVWVSGGMPGYTYNWTPSGGTDSLGINMPAGVYTVTGTDLNGCTITASVTISEPTPVSASTVLGNDVSCFGGSDGSATASGSGGTPGYTYQWSPSAGSQTTATASGLNNGIHTVTVSDLNGCTSSSQINIGQPGSLNLTMSATNASCNGLNDGTATVSAIGGTAAYTYIWSPFGGTNSVATSLTAGTYTVVVTDALGCTMEDSVVVNEPTAISVTTSQVDVNCNGDSTGSALVLVSGGVPGYTYNWSPVGGTAPSATDLPAGNYTVNIQDANGCTSVGAVNIAITQPSALSSNIVSSNDVSCFGGSDGDAVVWISGGLAPYTYNWSPTGGTDSLGTGLSSGLYTVTGTDANGCTIITNVTISEPTQVTSTILSSNNASCLSGSDGSATVSASGGTPGYTFLWSPSTGGQNTATASGLASGTHTVTVTDLNGCTSSSQVNIGQPGGLTVSVSGTDVDCNGSNTGQATASPVGGTSPYTYVWSPYGGTAATATNLSAGTFTVTVTDANGCTVEDSVVISQPGALTVTPSQNNVTCFGGQNGTAGVTVAGGTPAYSYNWLPGGETTATISNLFAGVYTVTVTDLNGCTNTGSVLVNITQPNAMVSYITSSTDVSCNGGNDGSAKVVTVGGTLPLTYAWSPSGGILDSAINLSAGTYTVTVYDANLCTSRASVTITEPTALTVQLDSVESISCNGASNGKIYVSASGGSPGYLYNWSPSGGSSATATGLAVGTYTVTVTDVEGCTISLVTNVTQPSPLTINTSQTNVSCFGGSNGEAIATLSGGGGSYSYTWSPFGGTDSIASNLTAGTYYVTVTENGGCTRLDSVIITEPADLTVNVVSTNVSCNAGFDGSATATPAGGVAPYVYSWSPTGGANAVAPGLISGLYTVEVTDQNGCTVTSTTIVNQPSPLSSIITASLDVSCNGNADGSATVLPIGGTAPLTTVWTPGPIAGTNITGLNGGVYIATTTDANGCTTTSSVTILEPSVLAANIVSSTDISCSGALNDGTATVVATGGNGVYTYAWTPSGGSLSTGTNLSAGTYTVIVTDIKGCTAEDSITITSPAPVSAITAQNDVTCFGGNDGDATVTAGGGQAPYTYLWSSGSTVSTANNLMALDYTVTITDVNGCSSTASVTITQPTQLTVTTTNNNISCTGFNDGDATATPAGGVGPYSYVWNPGGFSTNTIFGLSAGTYTVTVTDVNGCTVTATESISDPAPVSVSIISSTDVSCFGGSDGIAVSIVTGGTAPVSYAWSPSGGTGSTESGLVAGIFTVTATDAKGCTASAIATINQPVSLTEVVSSSDVTCNGGADGTASISVTGGVAPLSYFWSPSGGSDSLATGLNAGTYYITVTDANGCQLQDSVVINEPAALVASISSSSNVSCAGDNDGSATVLVVGGTPTYSYSWAPTGGTAATATGLPAGIYTVTATDLNGCTASVSVTITESSVLTATITSSTNVSCFNGGDGSATVAPAGGTGPYTYNWAPTGGTSASAIGLTFGIYTTEITDALGCTATATIEITHPSAITGVVSATEVTCNGGSDGFANIVASGGTSSYTYLWSSGGTTSIETGLSAGFYNVTVTDVNGCTNSFAIIVGEPFELVLAVNDVVRACPGQNTGSIDINVIDGTPPYSYNWSNGATTQDVGGLSAGTYTVTVFDANGCTKDIQNINVAAPGSPMSVSLQSINHLDCYGDMDGAINITVNAGSGPKTYYWSNGSLNQDLNNVGAGVYSVIVTDGVGCTATLQDTIISPPRIVATETHVNVYCSGAASGSIDLSVSGGVPPLTYDWAHIPGGSNPQDVSGLTVGIYTVDIEDANGCDTTINVSITQAPQTIITETHTDVSCNGGTDGSISLSVVGNAGPYSFFWSPAVGSDSTATNLAAGTYTVTITESGGCTHVETIIINEPTAVSLTTVSTNASCVGDSNATATITATGGFSPYTYLWSPNGETTSMLSGLSGGIYTVLVTDATGCTAADTVIISDGAAIFANINSSTNVSCFNGGDGTATVTVIGGVAPFTYNWSPTGGSAATATGLTFGNYTVDVIDVNGCSATATVEITQPAPITGVTAGTDVTCNGGNDGFANVVASGGTPSYSYLWSSGGTTSIETGMTNGVHTVTITDANGCTDEATVNISQPSPITISFTSTDIRCNGVDEGIANAFVFGGIRPYTYLWAGFGGTDSVGNNLYAGTYTVIVTDANGCTNSGTVTINEPPLLTATIAKTDILCNGETSGTATVIPIGGTPSYSYLWAPNGDTGVSTIGQPAGVYTVLVTDANGCTVQIDTTIVEPPVLEIVSNATTPVTCFGNNNGTAGVTVSGGSIPYTYNWTPTGGTGASASGLAGGVYIIGVTDANGCTVTSSLEVIEPAKLTSAIALLSDVSCNGGSNGSAVITPADGNGNYSYLWSGAGGTDSIATNLVAGTYTATITDANGCTTTNSLVVSEPAVFSINLVSFIDNNCAVDSIAEITVAGSGGISPYSYVWSSGETVSSINTLHAGVYTVTVSDAKGCSSTLSQTVTNPATMDVVVTSKNNISCNGSTDGNISVNVVGGTAAYSYVWSPIGGTTASATGLPADVYTVVVTDANGCSANETVILTEPNAIAISISSNMDVSCNGGADGSLDINTSGGSPSYSYLWSSASTNAIAAGLIAGTYTVTVTDANGCTETLSAIISQPSPMNISVNGTDLLCNGDNTGTATASVLGGTSPYAYTWSPFGGSNQTATNLPAGTYTVTATDVSGCTIDGSVIINEPVVLAATITSSTMVACNGGNTGAATVSITGGTPTYTYAWTSGGTNPTEINLTSGVYTVLVTDLNGCTDDVSVTITESPSLIASITSSNNISCFGGNDGDATVAISGGTAPFTYNWSPIGGTGTTANTLTVGTYTVNIIDANSCTAAASVVISEPNILAATTNGTDVSCNGATDGSASVAITGGTPGYMFNWSSGSTTNLANTLAPGTYTVTITDNKSCTTTATVNVGEPASMSTSTSSTNVTCFGANDGIGSVVVSGGLLPYSYLWLPIGGTGATASSLTSGTFTVQVTDAGGCTALDSVVISEPGIISISVDSIRNVSCNGLSDGIAIISASSGNPPYSYSWSHAALNSPTAVGLLAGVYTVTVRDANSCTSTVSMTINQAPPVSAVIVSSSGVSCFGDNDGTASVLAAGGTSPFTYNWSPFGGTASTSNVLTGGIFTVIISDANGCTSTASVNIPEPDVVAVTLSKNDVGCSGSNDGSASASITGGTPGFTYLWSNAGNSASINNLTSGTYTVTVTDLNGCSATGSINIIDPVALSVNVDSNLISCNGLTDGSITIIPSSSSTNFDFVWSHNNLINDSSVTGLSAGTYTVTVSDDFGCSLTRSVTLTEPTALVNSIAKADIDCNGNNTGYVSLSTTGGQAPYSYSWNPGSYTVDSVANLVAGTYIITVTDANGCSVIESVDVFEPSVLNAVISSKTDVTCFGLTNGTASVFVTGGSLPYIYSWNPVGGALPNAVNLPTGVYTVDITDANGCTATANVNISQPSPVAVLVTGTNASCIGSSDGTATATPSGGVGPYSYFWSPFGGTANIASGLTAMTFTCTVIDANGCSIDGSVVIGESSNVVTSIVSTNNVQCSGGSDGSAEVAGTGGATPYSYLWSDGQTTALATALPAGNYYVTVTDNLGCFDSDTITIIEPAPLVISVASSSDASCFGVSDANATVSVSGGTPVYNYAWSPSGGTSASIINVPSDIYTVLVTDANSCTATFAVTLNEPNPVIISIVSANDASCFAVADGSIEAIATGGASGFTYAWSPSGGTAALESGLVAGTYTVTGTDANGCTATASVSISQPAGLGLTVTGADVNCNGDNDGSALATVIGGVAPYTYVWSPFGGMDSVANGLTAGTYTVTVSDGNGCTISGSIVINELTPLTATTVTTNTNCGLSGGTATVTAGGGAGSYLYSWSPSGGNAALATGLLAGTYNVTVTDANGCSVISSAVVSNVDGGTATVSASSDVTCFGGSDGSATVTMTGGTPGYSYSWSPLGGTAATATGLTAGSYTVLVTDASGCTSIASIIISEPNLLTASISSSSDATCFGNADGTATVVVGGGTSAYSYNWSNGATTASVSGLASGAYVVTVTDASLCTASANIVIGQPNALGISMASTAINCNGGANGTATATVNGGTAPYSYLWSPFGGTNTIATGLIAGTYTVTVTDFYGCTISGTTVVTEPTLINVNLSAINQNLCFGNTNGAISIIANGGSGGYTYNWSPSGGTSSSATGLSAGIYTVLVSDINGCTGTLSDTIVEPTLLSSILTTSSDVSCYGGADGSATILATGGTAPHTYSWSPSGGNLATGSGLVAGNYIVIITDNNGCTATNGITINQPTALTASVVTSDANCPGGSDGTAFVTVTGGSPGYTYGWTPIGGTNSLATGLAANVYTVTVTDAGLCTVTATGLIGEPAALVVSTSTTDVSCSGGSDGMAVASTINGTAPYSYLWNTGAANDTLSNVAMEPIQLLLRMPMDALKRLL